MDSPVPTYLRRLLFIAVTLACTNSGSAQVRVTPQESKGGPTYGQYAEPWVDIPESFRDLKVPEWPVPTDLKRWQEVDRVEVRATLLRCLGDLPPRPAPAGVKVLSTEDRGDFTLEHFEFHNGVDMVVPGILAIPKKRAGPAPVVIGMHGHSGSKSEYLPNPEREHSPGWMLVRNGYVVAAIDGYFNGDRIGKGPRGERDQADAQELNLFKLHLWQGRTLWGMMLRDEQCLLDYLATRPEVDMTRVGATGMSMGCTRAWWLAAIDERVHAIVGVACFTRYAELLAHRSSHGIYYFVPGILKHFDSEAIYALVAPRPMLMLSGDQDYNAPPDGVEVLEKKIGAVFALYGQPRNFRSVLYKNTGHEYLPEMHEEMIEWFKRALPVTK
ncbi:MAG TPA: alpha/beta hydrolase family protein [Chthoniobacteraceae bacterium]|nr:alpha/beta hydrolase family protein [Chthoniobacteraceae bacterium]